MEITPQACPPEHSLRPWDSFWNGCCGQSLPGCHGPLRPLSVADGQLLLLNGKGIWAVGVSGLKGLFFLIGLGCFRDEILLIFHSQVDIKHGL